MQVHSLDGETTEDGKGLEEVLVLLCEDPGLLVDKLCDADDVLWFVTSRVSCYLNMIVPDNVNDANAATSPVDR